MYSNYFVQMFKCYILFDFYEYVVGYKFELWRGERRTSFGKNIMNMFLITDMIISAITLFLFVRDIFSRSFIKLIPKMPV